MLVGIYYDVLPHDSILTNTHIRTHTYAHTRTHIRTLTHTHTHTHMILSHP